MSFKEWLYDELVNDGVIDSDEVEADELTVDFLMETTELDECDIETYREQFAEHCSSYQELPIWDVE